MGKIDNKVKIDNINKFEEKLKTLEMISKINLTESEKETAVDFFSFFVDKCKTLEKIEIETENTEPLVTVSPLVNVMREDIAYKMTNLDALLENAPEHHDNYIVVPRILE